MKKILAKIIIKTIGWKVAGHPPLDINKAVILGAPHTTNWDFIVMIGVIWIYNLRLKFLIKSDWLKFPFKWFMEGMGAVGVDRTGRKSNLIDNLIKSFKSNEKFHLVITPEGSRSRVRKWKTGFYRIAIDANVPILMAYADYEKKEFGFSKVYYPTGDFEKDMTHIQNFYSNFKGKYPDQYNPKIF